jgi:plastocyanin
MTDTPPLMTTRRTRRIVSVVLAVLVLAAALASLPSNRRALLDPAGRDAVVGVTEVEVRDDAWEYFAYSPPVIEVPVGTEVTWTFASRAAHDVVFDDIASPVLGSGSWSRTFDTPGSYPYVCSLHTGMNGRVEVLGS